MPPAICKLQEMTSVDAEIAHGDHQHQWQQQGEPQQHEQQLTLSGLLNRDQCYKDASIQPDDPFNSPKLAGLWIFFILEGNRTHPIYIQAQLKNINSTDMGNCSSNCCIKDSQDYDLTSLSYVSDKQIMVNFYNSSSHSSPPHWKPQATGNSIPSPQFQ